MAPRKQSSVELKLANQVTDLLLDQHDLKEQVALLQERLVLVESGDESSLAPLLPPQESDIVIFLETLFIRGLTISEAYFLGRMVSAYGPQRVQKALEQKRNSKQVIRAAYAMLNNGAQGKPAPQKEAIVPSVRWWEATETYDPHSMEDG